MKVTLSQLSLVTTVSYNEPKLSAQPFHTPTSKFAFTALMT